MRGSRVITTAILVLMLVAVMGLRDAKAQTPVACDAIPFTDGWISMTVAADAAMTTSSFVYNAGLLGTVENFNGDVIAGLDWLYDDRQPNLETNMVGTQLVSWWTRKDGRNTIIQATNTNPETDTLEIILSGGGDPVTTVEGSVTVHVQILGEDCLELRNFCDTFTPLDTVVYDLSDLTSNAGQTISVGNLAEREGIIVITPVETCVIASPPTFDAVSFNYMQGNARIINETGNWEYGTNIRARTAEPPEPYEENGTATRNFVWDYYSAVDPSTCDDDPMGPGENNCPANALFKDFNSIGTNPGADLVLMSFGDFGLCGDSRDSGSMCDRSAPPANMSKACGPGAPTCFGTPGVYSAGPFAADSQFGPFAIFDDAENPESCPPVFGCFLRIGIDEGIPSTDDVTPLPPEPQCDFIDGEPNCANPLCKQEVGCENFAEGSPEGLCEDGIDNDEVDGTDCADFGCDGFVIDSESGAQCESGGETSCADGFDNDNNGLIDCGEGDILPPDPNCVAIGACGTPDDGGDGGDGGCTVAAGPVSGGTAAANILLALLPLAGVFAVRRIIRRRK